MGLLDTLRNPDPATAQGLLQMGLALLQSKGNFGAALGQSGMAGLQGAQQYRQQDFMRKLQQDQLAQMEQRKKAQEAWASSYRPPSLPGVDATGGMETAMDNPANAANPRGSFDLNAATNAMMGLGPQQAMQALQLQALTQKKEPALQEIDPTKNYGTFSGGRFNQLISGQPKPDKPDKGTTLGQLLAEMNQLPPNDPRRAIYENAIAKATTHQPPVQIANYGSPVPVELPGGGIGYAQPSNRGGPVQPMRTASGEILKKPNDAKNKELTEGQSKATLYLGMMRASTAELQKMGALDKDFAGQAEVAAAGTPLSAFVSAKAQRTQQAKYQWAEAMLRALTGAAAPDAEVRRNIETFFPKVGDKPEQVAQKKRQRAEMEKAIEISAGRGAAQLGVNPELSDQSDPLGLRK